MKLILGLGNPGAELEKTRHNLGRNCAQYLAKQSELKELKEEKYFFSLLTEGKIGKEKVVVALPQTFMNKSGQAASALVKKYKIKPADVIILHDDSDIELGRVKFSFAKHSAGHKGVESVRRALGTWDFWRIRMGIQKKKRIPAMDLVLKKLSPDEERIAKKIFKHVAEGIKTAFTDGFEKAMSLYNK